MEAPNWFETSDENRDKFIRAVAHTAGEAIRRVASEGGWTETAPVGVPYNATNGIKYSGSNLAMLQLTAAASGYDDARWVTMKELKSFQKENPEKDIHVRKGEMGTTVLRQTEVFFTKDKEGKEHFYSSSKTAEYFEKLKNGGEEIPQIQSKVLFYPHTVFNASQIEGFPQEENPSLKYKNDSEKGAFIDRFIESTGIPVQHHDGDSRYNASEDTILMPHSEKFQTEAEYSAVKLHEFMHAAEHPSRENFDGFGDPRMVGELRAGIFSILAGSHFGLPMPFESGLSNRGFSERDTINRLHTFLQQDPKAAFQVVGDAAKMFTTLHQYECVEQPRAEWFPPVSEMNTHAVTPEQDIRPLQKTPSSAETQASTDVMGSMQGVQEFFTEMRQLLTSFQDAMLDAAIKSEKLLTSLNTTLSLQKEDVTSATSEYLSTAKETVSQFKSALNAPSQLVSSLSETLNMSSSEPPAPEQTVHRRMKM